MKTNIIRQLTELQAVGGGYFTEAFPTNFHHFYKRKVLVGNETADMFKDVTASEKSALEAQDAKWAEPSEEFIAMCAAEEAVFNRATGYFEMNGITNLTEAQMRAILPYLAAGRMTGSISGRFQKAKIRTITVCSEGASQPKLADWAFYGANIETMRFNSITHGYMCIDSCYYMFYVCSNLKTVFGVVDLGRIRTGVIDMGFGKNFVSIQLKSLATSITFAKCPNLSMETLEFMVDNARGTAPITVTLHPDAYARLTDALLENAASKQITFQTTE